jgi:hypothetical protein
MKKTLVICLAVIFGLNFSSCIKEDNPLLSAEKSVLSFKFENLNPVVTASIDQTTKQITAVVPPGTVLTELVPTILVSDKSSVNPPSGSTQNFTGPVIYTVTAENTTSEQYTVNVSVDATGTETLSGTMSANRVLTKRNNNIDYVIDGELYIDGNALLTIEPGVKIAFSGIYSGIVVGENAGLKMAGTANEPIILTGPVNNNNKGAWAGIRYRSNRADNLIEYVHIINAGNTNSEAALYLEYTARVSVKNTMITRSLEYGVLVWGGKFSEFSNNTISECEKAPIWADRVEVLGTINNSNAFINNGNPFVLIQYSSSPEIDFTLKKLSIPYLFRDGLAIDKTFTLEAGTQMLMYLNTEISIYENGRMIANGDAQNPIHIRGALDEPGSWKGIVINSNRDNTFNHCFIRNGGSDTWWISAAIHMYGNTRLTIHNTNIAKSTTYGIHFDYNCSITHSNVSFTDCAMGNVYDSQNDQVLGTLP